MRILNLGREVLSVLSWLRQLKAANERVYLGCVSQADLID